LSENANFPKSASLPGLDRQHDLFQMRLPHLSFFQKML
jgi:hypothetical protein